MRSACNWYDEFTFHKIYHAVNDFCVVDLSAFYFDVLKDRLYTYAPNSPGRRSAQTAMWRILEAMVRLLAPILSFTCEEVWQFLPKVKDRPESVHLATFPGDCDLIGSQPLKENDPEQNDWAVLRSVRNEVLKALEEARTRKEIGTGLEAQVTITAAEPTYSLLMRHADSLRYLFIVSAVHRQGIRQRQPARRTSM